MNIQTPKNAPTPIQDWQNVDVKGLALCSDGNFDDFLKKTQRLRDQQAAFKASVPTELKACVEHALKAVCGDEFYDDLDLLQSHLIAIEQIARADNFDEAGVSNAVAHLAIQIQGTLFSIKNAHSRCELALRNAHNQLDKDAA